VTLLGLLSWFCLLVSSFAHLATFFVGGTFDSVLAAAPMLVAASLVWIGTLRLAASEGRPFWKGMTVGRRLTLVIGLLYVVSVFVYASRFQVASAPSPAADPRSYALTYDGKVQGKVDEAYREYGARLAARKWTAFWMLIYLGPVLYYGGRRPEET
jgi:hypothetical protein